MTSENGDTPQQADSGEPLHHVDPAAKTVFRIRSAIPSLFLLGLAAVGAVIVLFTGNLVAIAIGLTTAGALALLVLAMWWFWPALVWKHLTYRVAPDMLIIRRGVLWRTETRVPRSRIQHTDVSEGPLERGLGLATLVVHTAGTRFATVDLPGLTSSTAQELRDALLGATDDDAL